MIYVGATLGHGFLIDLFGLSTRDTQAKGVWQTLAPVYSTLEPLLSGI